MKGRAWCFTANNADELPHIDDYEGAKFLVYQEEMGEEGTFHLQGFVYFSTLKSLRQVSNMGPQSHWSVARDVQASIAYCKKEGRLGGPYEFGEAPAQGKRNDLQAVRVAIDTGASNQQLWSEHLPTMIRYHRGFREYKRIRSAKRDWEMRVLVFIGSTGTGKTRAAYAEFPALYRVPAPKGSGTYWDDYDGQEVVLVDEMYGHYFSWSFLLQLLDRYECVVPCHGGPGHQFLAKTIVFTSNSPPNTWYPNMAFAPLERRITETRHFDPPLEPLRPEDPSLPMPWEAPL